MADYPQPAYYVNFQPAWILAEGIRADNKAVAWAVEAAMVSRQTAAAAGSASPSQAQDRRSASVGAEQEAGALLGGEATVHIVCLPRDQGRLLSQGACSH